MTHAHSTESMQYSGLGGCRNLSALGRPVESRCRRLWRISRLICLAAMSYSTDLTPSSRLKSLMALLVGPLSRMLSAFTALQCEESSRIRHGCDASLCCLPCQPETQVLRFLKKAAVC